MPWIRCPYGCYFTLPALNWGVFIRFPTSLLTCECCHRSNWAMFYQEDATAGAISAVNEIRMPNKPWQQEIEVTIKKRMSRLLGNINWFGYDQDLLIKQLYNDLVKMLINSELTSNFPTPKIWRILESGGQLKNMWAQGADSASKYGKERNEGELKFFGDLSGVSNVPTGQGRPFYIALNPGCLQQGAAPYYGRSYMVYKNAVKLRCSFTATDTLQMIKQSCEIVASDICSISTIGNILLRVSDRQLIYLCSLVTGSDVTSPNEFIEAQGWGTMSLSADIELIVISQNDLNDLITLKSDNPDLVPRELVNLGAEQRRAAINEMMQSLKAFCMKNGVTLKVLPLGPDTMNSRQTRI